MESRAQAALDALGLPEPRIGNTFDERDEASSGSVQDYDHLHFEIPQTDAPVLVPTSVRPSAMTSSSALQHFHAASVLVETSRPPPQAQLRPLSRFNHKRIAAYSDRRDANGVVHAVKYS